MRAILIGGAVAIALAVVAAGCGGGGGGGKRLSKSEFITKADAICAQGDKTAPKPPSDISNVDPTSSSVTDEQLDKFGDFLDDLVKHYRGEVSDLRDLKPPEDLQKDFNRALDLLDELLKETGEAADAAHDHDRAKFNAKLQESDEHSTEANKIAQGIGLKTCGQG